MSKLKKFLCLIFIFSLFNNLGFIKLNSDSDCNFSGDKAALGIGALSLGIAVGCAGAFIIPKAARYLKKFYLKEFYDKNRNNFL